MQIPRIYDANQLIPGEVITLDRSSSQHLVKVLRLKPGAELIVFNGDGSEYQALLIGVENKGAQVRVGQKKQPSVESPLKIHLGQGVSRGERMDYVVQKSVELGVYEITPLITSRCNVKLTGQRLEKRVDHWQKVAISACEQSGRCIVPTIHPSQSIGEWISNQTGWRLVCDPGASQSLSQLKHQQSNVALLIGAEGGLTDDEMHCAKQAGFEACSLGPRILRTETASVVAMALLQGLYGDL